MDLGKTLGNYRIDRLLGEGGMGAVYQAFDLTLQREVAIKLIHPHYARRPEFRERFMQEARLMARLDHPGIVKVYILGKEGDLLYLPMEFVKGGNLRQLLDKLIQQQKWIPLSEAVLLMRQLCQTVNYAHEHGVLHRDIKPANLMLKPEPTDGLPFRVVLTDLGLAKLLEGLGMTQEGTYVGTPAYMSPEQATGRGTDARSDVYSLGILLYELVVGRMPFPIRTSIEAIRYHTQERPPTPRSIRPDLPEALERVILKSLEKAPDNRYASAAVMAVALNGTISFSKEIPTQPAAYDSSLSTVYDNSLIEVARPESASLMTMFGGDVSLPTRGESVFAGQPLPPSSQTRIQVVYKEKTAQVFPFRSGTITIGRGANNDVPLSDPKASQRHAQVTWDGMEYHVMDLNSRNGTYLENTKLLPGIPEVWKPNQNLRIGDAWLRLLRSARDASQVSGIRSGISGMTSRPGSSLFTSSGAGLVGVSVNPPKLAVEAGESVTATITLLNQSPNVDHFSLSITGIPGSWLSSLPSNVQLMPGEQKETAFTLLVPRSPQSGAGRRSITLRVTSESDPSQFVEARLPLTIAAYSQFKAHFQTGRLQTGQPGRLAISNQGNAPETFTVQFSDAAGELTFEPSQPQAQVGPGETTLLQFHPKEKQSRWIGGEKLHSFTAQVNPANGEAQTLHADVISRGSIPVWVLPAVLFLCLLITGAVIALSILNRSATLTVIANGSGTVSSSPGGINNCNTTCSFDFKNNSNVSLVAAPISPSTFGGWSGGVCSGTSPTCDLKLSEPQTVTAIFNSPGSQTLIVNISGTGTVTSSPEGISNCSATCPFTFPENTTVTLTANPIPPAIFGGWSGGGCSGTSLTCTINMNGIQSVTATFNLSGKRTLTVTKSGTGTGTVTSSPAGIDCGSTCTFDFADNIPVTLTANPTPPSTFGGWGGGGCSGTATTCTVTMNQVQNVTATFNSPANQTLTVTKAGTGSGTITSSPAGIDCGPTCNFDFAANATVTLIANPTSPSTFGGWSGGGCSGTGTCAVTMNTAQTVTATFSSPANQTLIVNKVGNGSGAVTSSPVGINCGSTCAFDFAMNTTILLTANPTSPSTFGGWSGGSCSGTGTCAVTMSQAQTVTATFTLPANPTLTVTKVGSGTGIVTSSPTGVDCGSSCSAAFPINTTVTLIANPTSPSIFGGWSGGVCSGTSLTCNVTMSQAQNVTATFNAPSKQTLTVTQAGSGAGTVTSSPAGIDCGTDCSESYDFNTTVTLTASASSQSTFDGWSGGGCSGTASICNVMMNQAQTVTATFTSSIVTMPLTVVIDNGALSRGTVTIDPPGISCSAHCMQSYRFNTTVTLSANSLLGRSDFKGWGGACANFASLPTCIITMDQAQNVLARFSP